MKISLSLILGRLNFRANLPLTKGKKLKTEPINIDITVAIAALLIPRIKWTINYQSKKIFRHATLIFTIIEYLALPEILKKLSKANNGKIKGIA